MSQPRAPYPSWLLLHGNGAHAVRVEALRWHLLIGKESSPRAETVRINRAPVPTLWAAVVADRLGFDRDTAPTLGQAVASPS